MHISHHAGDHTLGEFLYHGVACRNHAEVRADKEQGRFGRRKERNPLCSVLCSRGEVRGQERSGHFEVARRAFFHQSRPNKFVPVRHHKRFNSLFSDNQGDLKIQPRPISHLTLPCLIVSCVQISLEGVQYKDNKDHHPRSNFSATRQRPDDSQAGDLQS